MPNEPLYVVFKTFRAEAQLFIAGDVLSQEDISVLKYQRIYLAERRFIPLEESEALGLEHYFKERWQVDLAANLQARVSKGSRRAEPESLVASEPPTPGTEPTIPPAEEPVIPPAEEPTTPPTENVDIPPAADVIKGAPIPPTEE